MRATTRVHRFGAAATGSALAAAILALVLIGGGPAGPGASDVAGAAMHVLAGAEIEAPVADVVVPASVAPQLPVPEPPPADPHAPTPEIRHGTLSIPAIGLEQPFFEGVTLTAINRGPSHWPGTAMPGHLGNVVIAGHRTTYTRPFWDLQDLAPGDELIFTMTDGTRIVYEATGIEIVSPTDIHIIDQTPEHTATLFGCHPRGSARQRIVGHFRLKSEPLDATAS